MFNDLFPGNDAALGRLTTALRSGNVTAFTGAGTSAPALPSWGKLIRALLDTAETDGFLLPSIATTLRAEHDDYLYVVDEIASAIGVDQLKSRISKIFSNLPEATTSHKLLATTAFKRYLTLNYDLGLEKALSSSLGIHATSIVPKQRAELRTWIAGRGETGINEILHWHGQVSHSDSIVLSNSDYIDFYDRNIDNREALREIFKNQNVVLIGFGFSDPFIVRQLNSLMQPLPTDNKHFAIIGWPSDREINIDLERRRFSTKFKVEAIFYPVMMLDGSSDHSALEGILRNIQSSFPRHKLPIHNKTDINELDQSEQQISYQSTLFSVGERTIYCEPNIKLRSQEWQEGVSISLRDIIENKCHSTISAPHEYGLTNLGRRLISEATSMGKRAVFKDALSMPNYRKKLLLDADLTACGEADFIVVLDNFSALEHQRLLKELVLTFPTCKCIVLNRTLMASGNLEDDFLDLEFIHYELHGLSRSNIREVVSIVSPSSNPDMTSSIVEKVYNDLLQLCIPLTPSNVVMYVSVLCRDGSFSPVSRLNIVDRFVSESLRRASDSYADTFNYQNKTDLVSAFCYDLLIRGQTTFQRKEWNDFCATYKAESLSDFNHTEILSDLLQGRIIVRSGETFYFKYRMFYSYFTGRYISSRPEVLKAAIDSNRHLELEGLLEVICGTLADSSEVLQDVADKYSLSLGKFYQKYPIDGLDFHAGVKWERQNDEEQKWESLISKLDEGPASTTELDQLKTSIISERRTADQKVSIIEFIASETNVSVTGRQLRVALESAKNATGYAKKAAAKVVVENYKLAYQVASVFAPLIAERKFVSWNGFAYVNLIESDKTESLGEDERRDQMISKVISSLPTSMAINAADGFGIRKLGPVFLALLGEKYCDPIDQLIVFMLVIRSKPANWLEAAIKFVSTLESGDIYFGHMLSVAHWQFRNEVNTNSERSDLKKLIAAMKLKRQANIKNPSNTAISKALGKLDSSGYWDQLRES